MMKDLDLPEYIERAGEVWLSCMLFMVQGDISQVTGGHALTALKVSVGVVVTYVVAKKNIESESLLEDNCVVGYYYGNR